MLQRSSQVGEFYRMSPPPVWDPTKKLPGTYMVSVAPLTRATQSTRPTPVLTTHCAPICFSFQDIMIYDEETDQLKHIPFAQALYATGLDGAQLRAALDWDTAIGRNPLVAPTDTAPPAGVMDGIAAGAMDAAGLIAAVNAGVWMPVCITIARPFMEHLMMSAIACVSGRDTGATLFGPADMQISANTSVKTIEGESAPSPIAPTAPTTSPI